VSPRGPVPDAGAKRAWNGARLGLRSARFRRARYAAGFPLDGVLQVPNATEMKKGMVIQMDGALWRVMDAQHVTPGNWRGMVQAVLRNLKTGAKHEKRFRSTESIETAFIDVKEFQYLYSEKDRGLHYFMDTESYEQVSLDNDLLGDSLSFLIPNEMVKLELHDHTPVGIQLPASVVLTITETTPGTRGDTVTNTRKEATVETGHKIKVPLFIEEGEKVRVDTRTGDFMERVSG
jgi:elongation factor P